MYLLVESANDYIGPINSLMNLLLLSKRYRLEAKYIAARRAIGFKILSYLSCTVTGFKYPRNVPIPDDKAIDLLKSVHRYMLKRNIEGKYNQSVCDAYTCQLRRQQLRISEIARVAATRYCGRFEHLGTTARQVAPRTARVCWHLVFNRVPPKRSHLRVYRERPELALQTRVQSIAVRVCGNGVYQRLVQSRR